MAFFDKAKDLTKKFGEAAQTAAKSAVQTAKEKSEQAIEIGKLKKAIMVENGKINKRYDDIGRNAYDLYCSHGDFGILEPLYQEITASLAKIEENKVKIEEIKNSSGLDDDELENVAVDLDLDQALTQVAVTQEPCQSEQPCAQKVEATIPEEIK